MTRSAPLPSFAAIIVAAGKGLRAGQGVPKQFAPWRGKPLVRHSAEALLRAGAQPLVVVIPDGGEEIAREVLAGLEGIRLVTGGASRQQSVRNGLETLASGNPDHVLIHDAARPNLPEAVIDRLLGALDRHEGAIPVLPLVDSIAHAGDGNLMAGPADRAQLRRVQTPQAFRFAAILAAHREWQGEPDAGDDAQVLLAWGGSATLVAGDERLAKVTFAEDFQPMAPTIRFGQGFDVHRLEKGCELWLCGINIPHEFGLSGHSDADVAIHALVDALLGAIAAGDIGSHFPPSDPQWQGAPSHLFLTHAAELVAAAGYAIGNIDLTLICEAPRIGPYRDAMRKRLAELLGLAQTQVSVKATTSERLGFTGRGEGIAAQAIVCLQAIGIQ